MKPRTTKADALISIEPYVNGLAGSQPWEKETLVDYIAYQICVYHGEIIDAEKNGHGIGWEGAYNELCQISQALKKNAGRGLSAPISFGDVVGVDELCQFVEWEKEELADYLVRQIIVLDLPCVVKEESEFVHRIMKRLHVFATAIISTKCSAAWSDAEADATMYREIRAGEKSLKFRERAAAELQAIAAKFPAEEAPKTAA